jgi:hypothetical protein
MLEESQPPPNLTYESMCLHNLLIVLFTSKINKRKINISLIFLVTCCEIYWIPREPKEKHYGQSNLKANQRKKVKAKGGPKFDKSNRFEDCNKLNGSTNCWEMHENTICYNLDSSNCKGRWVINFTKTFK